MRFSLVVATVDRTTELARFLAALAAQTHTNFELIVVDQNGDERLVPVLAPYVERFALRHLRAPRGLSKARNVGLRHLRGDIVAFPDDDCWYPPQLLAQVVSLWQAHRGLGGLTGRSVAPQGGSSGNARFDPSAGPVTVANVWRRACSYTMFFERKTIETVGDFDETLGLGAGTPWEGGEDIDYPVRALKAGLRLYYDPTLQVQHPSPVPRAERAYRYGAGIGRVWRKHRFPLWYVMYHLLRPLAGSLLHLSLAQGPRMYYHWCAFRGRLTGWRSRCES